MAAPAALGSAAPPLRRLPRQPADGSMHGGGGLPSASGRCWPPQPPPQLPRGLRQRCRSAAPVPADAGGPGAGRAAEQAQRFRHAFQPGSRGAAPPDTWLSWPLREDPSSSQRVVLAGEQDRLDPQQLWGPGGGVALHNPHVQRCRVSRVPVPSGMPGSEFWSVELLQDYSSGWPSLRRVGGKWQLRKGFLAAADDPKVVPFFLYRGLEQFTYSWSDRAAQALFAAAYAGVHLAVLGWLWSSSPLLAAAAGLSWGLGRLSPAKLALLLFLSWQQRLWLYFLYLGGKAADALLARLFPPVRRFFWAMFTVWALYLVLSPTHYPPLPFWPFAPGSLGPHEALC